LILNSKHIVFFVQIVLKFTGLCYCFSYLHIESEVSHIHRKKRVITHTFSERMENLQSSGMFFAFLQHVVNPVWPQPWCSLSLGDDVTHSARGI